MRRLFNEERRERFEKIFQRLRSIVESYRTRVAERLHQTSIRRSASARIRGPWAKSRPLLEITRIQPPMLVVFMGGTAVRDYESAGQLGRLSTFLEQQANYFRTVLLMTPDRTNYTERFASERVRHARNLLPVLTGGTGLLLSAIVRFRTVRKATSVVILDEESAPVGWLASRLSGANLSMSTGAPWSPPRYMDVDRRRHWLVRTALKRVMQVVVWPNTESPPAVAAAEVISLQNLIDTDLFCPLTTTDPARPRTVGVFLGMENEADARVMIGVAERLARRKRQVVLRVFVNGDGAEARASTWQAEVSERGQVIEFQTMPRPEMLPDAIARMRMCIAFDDPTSVQNLLQAMACGVPGIAVKPRNSNDDSEHKDVDKPGWSRFILACGPIEEEIANNIEALFREPGVRLRMAREGRRFVIANHSLAALAAQETKALAGPERFGETDFSSEPAFDADAEAEKLSQMLELLGVMRTESVDDLNTAA